MTIIIIIFLNSHELGSGLGITTHEFFYYSVQFQSLSVYLCDPMDTTARQSVTNSRLLKLMPIRYGDDAIQPYHPLSLSPPPFNLSLILYIR